MKRKTKNPKEACFKENEDIRRNTLGIFLLLFVLLPAVIFLYFNIRPFIESVYIVTFSKGFASSNITISTYNYSSTDFEEIHLTPQDYGVQDKITTIAFGLYNFDGKYTAVEFQDALVENKDNRASQKLEQNKYIEREYDFSGKKLIEIENTEIKFKASPQYQLFFIRCEIKVQFGFIETTIGYYAFFSSHNQRKINQHNYIITLLEFNKTLYEEQYRDTGQGYPYIIRYNYHYELSSFQVFDFTFR